MSTSLMYHGFGIRGYDYVSSKYAGGAVMFTLRPKAFELQCSSCESSKVIRRGTVGRKFRYLPIGRKPVLFLLAAQRVECPVCGLVRQAKTGFPALSWVSSKRSQLTKSVSVKGIGI